MTFLGYHGLMFASESQMLVTSFHTRLALKARVIVRSHGLTAHILVVLAFRCCQDRGILDDPAALVS